MFKILFLILVVMCSTVFAQQAENKEQKEQQKAYMFAEIGKVDDAAWKENMEKFSYKMYESKTSTGYIVNYGRAGDVSKREIQIRNSLGRYCHDCRLVIVNGGESDRLKTEFWIVPTGSEPPSVGKNNKTESPPKAVKLNDFGNVSGRYLTSALDKFSEMLNQDKTLKGLVINYTGRKASEEKSFEVMEEKIKGYAKLQDLILQNRVVFVRGRNEEFQRTVFWIIPEGAEPPTP